MPFAHFLLNRLAGALLMLVAVSALVFLMTDVLPGDVASRILGRNPDPEKLAILRERLSLDQPLLFRYLGWLGSAFTGDFGVSLVSGQPVSEIVGRRLFNSCLLACPGVPDLPAARRHPRRGPGRAPRPCRSTRRISVVALAILSIPDFLLGTILLILFASVWPLAPARATIDSAMGWLETIRALILPATTVALVMGTYAMRYLRDSLIEALDTEYVRIARLNGIPERRCSGGMRCPTL
jgi:peptide/nickel transport system permease protein